MKNLPTYRTLCTQYYDLDKPTVPEKEFNFYLHYVQKAGGNILEPMCGTGRFLLPLVMYGFHVDGFDASNAMLDALRAKCTLHKPTPIVWHGYLHGLSKINEYKLVFIPSGSINLILDYNKMLLSLQKIYACLQPGGTFVFEFITFEEAKRTTPHAWTGNMHEASNGKKILLSTMNLPINNDIGETICRYDLIEENKIIKTDIEFFKIKFYQLREIENMLSNVGFSNIKILKAFEHTASPDAQDTTVIFECEKAVKHQL